MVLYIAGILLSFCYRVSRMHFECAFIVKSHFLRHFVCMLLAVCTRNCPPFLSRFLCFSNAHSQLTHAYFSFKMMPPSSVSKAKNKARKAKNALTYKKSFHFRSFLMEKLRYCLQRNRNHHDFLWEQLMDPKKKWFQKLVS